MHTTTQVRAGRFGRECSAGSEGRDRRLDLAGLGKAAGAVLGVHHFAVGNDVEDAAGTLDEFGIHVEPLFQVGRQTGGPGVVVSGDAVGNADIHVDSSHRLALPPEGFIPVPELRRSREPGREPEAFSHGTTARLNREGGGIQPGATPAHNPSTGRNNPPGV